VSRLPSVEFRNECLENLTLRPQTYSIINKFSNFCLSREFFQTLGMLILKTRDLKNRARKTGEQQSHGAVSSTKNKNPVTNKITDNRKK
jgi:hypothetical protein